MKLPISASEAYADWILSLSEHFHNFCTFTFGGPTNYSWAYKKGVKLWRLTNECVCGRRFREKNKGLYTVYVVETRHGQPHIHFLQDQHPLLTQEAYVWCWRKAYGRKFSPKALLIEPIHSKEAVSKYITKNITWENSPFIFIPKDKPDARA